MSEFDSPLNNIRIASPCQADWNEMYGDNRKRFCGDCKLNVYNLSGMTRDEAEALVMNAEGRLCVRFYKRADGSVITQDCPVGLARVKQRTRILATALASIVMALFTGILFASFFSKMKATMGEIAMPIATPAQASGVVVPAGYICNEWGHCWHRHYGYSYGYYHPHYWGGWGWHRHYWRHWHRWHNWNTGA